ncbi:hypothetical protein ACFWH1_08780 [Streptomyces sp. NPDC127037]|uniref:hypothetical protein n=1 Tax=Streptomyces sp. NPDC127037 TaxID=3347113 RepID=UPI003651CAC9
MGASPQEAAILQAAEAFLGEERRDRARKRQEEDARRTAEAEEWRRHREAAATRDRQALLVAQAQERRARNRARGLVQSITRLRREALSAQQQRKLVQKLTVAAKEAGDLSSEAERDRVRKWTTKLTVEEPGTATAEASPVLQPRPDVAADPAKLPERLAPAVAAVRGALKWAGRERTATSWSRLEHQPGSALPSLSNNERLQLLVEIDRSTADDAPLLSSLIAAGDPHFAYQYYRRVLTGLDLDASNDDNDLRDVVEADADRVFTDRRFQ